MIYMDTEFGLMRASAVHQYHKAQPAARHLSVAYSPQAVTAGAGAAFWSVASYTTMPAKLLSSLSATYSQALGGDVAT